MPAGPAAPPPPLARGPLPCGPKASPVCQAEGSRNERVVVWSPCHPASADDRGAWLSLRRVNSPHSCHASGRLVRVVHESARQAHSLSTYTDAYQCPGGQSHRAIVCTRSPPQATHTYTHTRTQTAATHFTSHIVCCASGASSSSSFQSQKTTPYRMAQAMAAALALGLVLMLSACGSTHAGA